MEPTPHSRLQVALPAILTFIFGLGAGIVVGYVAWSGKQVTPSLEPPPMQEAAAAPQGQGGEDNPEEYRKRLALHEALLEKNPEDIRLLRTVGNYHGLLGDNARAMEVYAKAETVARKETTTDNLVEVLTDQAVSLTELDDLPGALAKLKEAEGVAPKDTRSRLTHAVILMTRVMPNPPPGFDRKSAVLEAEQLLKDVLAIEPAEPNAVELLGMIASIRSSMGRSQAAGAPGEAPGTAPAPASAPSAETPPPREPASP